MGRPKQLLPLDNKPVIRHCLESILAAGVRDIVVVLGADGEATARAIAGMPVRTAFNHDPRSEMAESLRTGLRELSAPATGVLVCLSDHPLVAPATIRQLVKLHAADHRGIFIPEYRGKRGHPTLFPAPVIGTVFSGKTLREVIAGSAGHVHTVEVDDEGVILDMDTPEEYERIRGRFLE